MTNATSRRESHANLVNQFEEAWIEGRRPAIAEMLSDHVADRVALLTNMVDLEMEFRWKAGESFRVEEYFQNFPELKADGETALRLIQKEFELRRRTNQPPTLTEYQQRFPDWAEDLVGNAQTLPLSIWHSGIRLSHGATRDLYADVLQKALRMTRSRKSRYPAGADAEKSQWLANAVKELFEPNGADPQQQALFRTGNRALANELFTRWAATKTAPTDPAAVFLDMAESIRAFLMEQAKANATEVGELAQKVSGEIPETTLAAVLANPDGARQRDARWESLRSADPIIYKVNVLDSYTGRTPREIAVLLDLSTDEVHNAVHEGRQLLAASQP